MLSRSMTSLPIRSPVRILGIDPGLRRTGWGVIDVDGNRLIYVGCGSVESPRHAGAGRTPARHSRRTRADLGEFQPMEAAVEATFVNKDGASTLKLGQARGVAMLAPAMAGILVAEYAPNQVKKTVVGAGHADKNQIQVMLEDAFAEGRSENAGRRRRACHCDHARASSAERDAEAESGQRMIGKLKGLINSYGEDYVILDVQGVGYQVHCSARTLQALPSPGEAAVLSIETYVREDQIKLFGFRSDVEREWFRLLQTVQGVGAKVALAVLGTLPPSDLANAHCAARQGGGCAHARRRPESRRAHRDRIERQGAGLRERRSGARASCPALSMNDRAPRPVSDAISALVNLGYGQPQAAAAIAQRRAAQARMPRPRSSFVSASKSWRSERMTRRASSRPNAAPTTSAIRRCGRRILSEFVGQQQARANLQVFIDAARKRNEALDHVLFVGPPGLGKTTLAQIVARELGVGFRATSGPVIAKAGDLAALLTNLEERDVLFIDEIHRLNPAVEEILYPAMEDFQLDLIIGEGPAARSVKIDLAKFTLVGATTRAGLLTNPLRDRFGIPVRLNFYTEDELEKIVTRGARVLNIGMTPDGANEIARRARGTPRIAGTASAPRARLCIGGGCERHRPQDCRQRARRA